MHAMNIWFEFRYFMVTIQNNLIIGYIGFSSLYHGETQLQKGCLLCPHTNHMASLNDNY